MSKKQEEADYIQSLSVTQLKALEADVQWVEMDLSEEPVVTKTTKRQYADFIQSLSLEELRAYTSNLQQITFTHEEDEVFEYDGNKELHEIQNFAVAEPQTPYGLEAKMQKTGLTKAQILTIEKDKTQATLAELMLYCKGLNIPYTQILPELYIG
jgi:transcriptional regulator with XRE-family HTH domain